MKFFRSKKNQKALLFAAILSLTFTNLWVGTLGGDESLYALLARQILRSGDWLVLHHPYYSEWRSFYEHPPLYMWITAINFKLFGINDFSAKLFSALTGAGTIILLYYTGRKLADHKYGLFSAFILLTTIYFLDYTRKARLEVPLTFFMLLSFYFLLLALNNKNYIWSLLSGAATALAFLSKGIPALAMIPMIIFAFLFYTESNRRGYSQIAIYIAGVCILLVPWAGLNILYDNGAFFNWYINKQVLWSLSGRTGSSTNIHFFSGFSLFYIKKLLFEVMVPWFPFVIISSIRKKDILRRLDKKQLLPILISVIILLAFSFAAFKKTRYILPALPFLSLIAADFFTDRKWTEKAAEWFSGALAVIVILVFIFAFILPEKLYNKTDQELVSLADQINNSSMPGDTVLVSGIKEYTVRQVFSWYFDHPQRTCLNDSDFNNRLRSGNYKIAVEKSNRGIIDGDIPKQYKILVRGKYDMIYSSASK